MNQISKIASIPSCLKIGKNNIIGKNVKILENVIIGDNNKIYDDTIIYPNTKIGNNNIFLHRNKIGEIGVQSSFNTDNFEFKYNGLEIGNNNFFHVDNIVFNGYDNKTIIGDYNKILGAGSLLLNPLTEKPYLQKIGLIEDKNCMFVDMTDDKKIKDKIDFILDPKNRKFIDKVRKAG